MRRHIRTSFARPCSHPYLRLTESSLPLPCPSSEAPKGLGTKLPSKKEKKDKAAAGGEAAAAAAAGGEGGATPAAAKKEKEAVSMQRVEAKSWEVGAGGLGCAAGQRRLGVVQAVLMLDGAASTGRFPAGHMCSP